MPAAHVIRVANDNGPTRPESFVQPRSFARPAAIAPLPEAVAEPTRGVSRARKGRKASLALALIYHLALLGVALAAMFYAQPLDLVGGLFALAALGGVLCVSLLSERRWFSRGALAVTSAAAATLASLLLLPIFGLFGGVSPAALAVSAVAMTAADLHSKRQKSTFRNNLDLREIRTRLPDQASLLRASLI